MRYLLDTHTFLWWIVDSDLLSERVRDIMSDGANTLYLSAASGWEIVIKADLGRLQLPDEPGKVIPEQMSLNTMVALPIQMSHALHVHSLPKHHRDPFDRMLVAQSQVEELPILTSDPQIAKYEVDVVW
jgi:PIN domain nuclease of toxin-antitoxin system